MTEIDSMVQELRHLDVSGRYKKGDDLAEQLTARLERPSREEVERLLNTLLQWRLIGTNGAEARRAEQRFFDLVCGPEPKPKGKPIRRSVFGECAPPDPEHTWCPGGMVWEPYVMLCNCECHQEDIDVQ